MTFTINILIGFDPTLMHMVSSLAARWGPQIDRIIANQEKIMATLDDILADTAAETTAIASISTLIKGLRDQIAEQLNLNAVDQAKIDEIFAAAEANKTALADALAENVPPA